MAFKTVPKWILVILLTENEHNYYSLEAYRGYNQREKG